MRAVHESGRLTARDMVHSLLDEGSFVEIDALARHRCSAFGADANRPTTDGIVSGHGTVDGRPVCVFAQDDTIFDGQLGEVAGEKILKVLELALKSGSPIVGIYQGSGARIQEGLAGLDAYSRIYRLQCRASGVIPQIALVTGDTTGAQVFGVALSDVVVQVAERSKLELSPGDEACSDTDATSGTCHILTENETHGLNAVADVLAFLPSNNRALALAAEPTEPCEVDLDTIIPDEPSAAYDVWQLIGGVVDRDSLVELQPRCAPNIRTAFARLDGRSVGIVANQPEDRAGGLDADASEKAARFIRLCDAFNVPIVSFVDTPGFLPACGEPIVRRSAKLLAATANASVGILSVITRKAYGTAYLALGAKRMGTDFVFAWPTAQIAVADVEDVARAVGQDADALTPSVLTPYEAAARGLVDAVIPPSTTRERLVDALELLERKVDDSYPRKHETIAY